MATDGTVAKLARQFHERSWDSQMAPRLKSFLDLVWQNRRNAKLDIYQLYCGRPHVPVEVDYGQVFDKVTALNFLETIERIDLDPEIPMVQCWGTGLRQMEAMWRGFRNSETLETSDESLAKWLSMAKITQKEWIYRDLAKSFFHFKRNDTPANHRLYVNILPAHRAEVTAFIVGEVFDACPYITNAKVLGPLNLGFDAMVIYLSNPAGEATVLSCLAEYQRTHNFFGEHVVSIAKPVTQHLGKKLRGIASACEPYAHSQKLFNNNKRPSFGDFWEMMLTVALDSTRNLSNEDFYRHALQLMELAGIDPLNPHI